MNTTKIRQHDLYPYTYSADFLRILISNHSSGILISRSDATTIRETLAKAIGISDDLACSLADYYEDNKKEIDRPIEEPFFTTTWIAP